MENKEQVYSLDDSHYMNWENLMDELREKYNDGEEVEVWEADKEEWRHSDFFDVLDLIEGMQDNAMCLCGEFAEEYLNEVDEDIRLDLANTLTNWFNKNSKLKFYGVENERKTVVVVE